MRVGRVSSGLILFTMIATGCPSDSEGGGGTPTVERVVTPTVEVVEIAGVSGDVSCEISAVRAGDPSALRPIEPCGPSTALVPIAAGGLIDVSAQGEARVDVQGCGSIYVFEQGQLKLSGCRRQDLGSTACAVTGTSAYQNSGCDQVITIQTVSAEIVTTGTWFTVTVDPDTDLTLVTVLEGSVEVTPFEIAGDRTSVVVAEMELIEAGEFYFTTPVATELDFVAEVPARMVVTLPAVTPVLDELVVAETFDDVRVRAIDAEAVPEQFALSLNAQVVRVDGSALDGDLVNGLSLAVPWQELVEDDRGVVVIGEDPTQAIQLDTGVFDADRGIAFLSGLEQSNELQFVLEGADTDLRLAEQVQQFLSGVELDIELGFEQFPGFDGPVMLEDE